MQPPTAPSTYYSMLASVKTTPTPLCRKAESRDELFASTRWTLVFKAGDSAATSAHALSALSELCQIYWRPLYVFLRKKGYGREDAQDLTQGFFAHLIETRGHARADPAKGRFRAFSHRTKKFHRGCSRSPTRIKARWGNDSRESR